MYSYVQSMLYNPAMDSGNNTVLISPPSNSQLQNLPASTVYAFYILCPLINITKRNPLHHPCFLQQHTAKKG